MAATIPHYTVEALDQFPRDGNGYELLDGVLLVTPAPGMPHQLVAARIVAMLTNALGSLGFVVGPGAVSFPPRTQLEPDILAIPASMPPSGKWSDRPEWDDLNCGAAGAGAWGSRATGLGLTDGCGLRARAF